VLRSARSSRKLLLDIRLMAYHNTQQHRPHPSVKQRVILVYENEVTTIVPDRQINGICLG
jgi:hypothetical protein